MTRIAVALPVRNGENYLSPAIESILAQEFSDFKLFISDNYSTDGTREIIDKYCYMDSRIIYSKTPQFISLGANMNRAVSIAEAEWVKLFCHDDLMRQDCLLQIDSIIKRWGQSGVAIIGNGSSHLLNSDNRSPEIYDQPHYRINGNEAARQHLLGARNYPMPAVTTATVKKFEFFQIGGFDERFEHFDHFCWLRMMIHHDLAIAPDTLTANRIHEKQVTYRSRVSLGWLRDSRVFMQEYLEENSDQLNLTFMEKCRASIIPLSVAAKSLTMELRERRLSNFIKMVPGIPKVWWPLMPALILRSWWHLNKHETKIFKPK